MDSNNHRRIENLATKALNAVDCKEPPVPVGKIANKFNLKVINFEFHKDVSGVLKKDKNVIGVNSTHHPLRQRFSITHELGHYLLGHESYDDNELIIDGKFDKPLPHEREANIFASCLLMPKEWVKKYIDTYGIDLKKMANKFQVSEQAMTIRLLELNLIK